ncbi:hypothetical protein D3C71_341820 [compost metagenome]
MVMAVQIGDDVARALEQFRNPLAIPEIMRVLGIERIVPHDDDRLAAFSRVGKHLLQPGELPIADAAIPRHGIDGAGSFQCGQTTACLGVTRMPLRSGEQAHLVAVDDYEADAAAQEMMPGGRHAETRMNLCQPLRRNGKIVVAGKQDALVAQPFVDGKNRVEAFPVAINQIPERHDESEILAVQRIDRFRQLLRAVAVIPVVFQPRFDICILGIGDDAEAEERFFRRHGAQLGSICDRGVTDGMQIGCSPAIKTT